MRPLVIDSDYLLEVLLRLLGTPSPSGYTDQIVRVTCKELEQLGVPFELTRRGAIRADLKGAQETPARAVVAHLDSLGAMVSRLKENGRLEIVPIGTWSARFAEGARVTVFTDRHPQRGTILPLKASGHAFDHEVDTQPVSWDNLELRMDVPVRSLDDLRQCGFNVGDYVAIDPRAEVEDNGYINARHLDDKAGVAIILATAKALKEAAIRPPVDAHLLFTISEEVGSGASSILHGNIAEMVTIDNGTQAQGQNTTEHVVTIAMKDSAGPFDWHLTHKLLDLCDDHGIQCERDVFRYYRSDSASAIEAGNDIRTALVCFGVDASHGYERTHLDSLRAVAELVALYLQCEPAVRRDRQELGPLKGFPTQPT